MLWMVETPYVANYDCDILLPKTSYAYAVNLLKNGFEENGETIYPKVVYPYGRGQFQAQITATDEEVSDFMNKEFSFEVFQNWRAYDAKFGFVQFFDTETYKELGGENEGFVAYGYEDDERHFRFNLLSSVGRIHEYVYHLEHGRTKNSWFNNPYCEDNKKLWEELKVKGKKSLTKYYQEVDYIKRRNG